MDSVKVEAKHYEQAIREAKDRQGIYINGRRQECDAYWIESRATTLAMRGQTNG